MVKKGKLTNRVQTHISNIDKLFSDDKIHELKMIENWTQENKILKDILSKIKPSSNLHEIVGDMIDIVQNVEALLMEHVHNMDKQTKEANKISQRATKRYEQKYSKSDALEANFKEIFRIYTKQISIWHRSPITYNEMRPFISQINAKMYISYWAIAKNLKNSIKDRTKALENGIDFYSNKAYPAIMKMFRKMSIKEYPKLIERLEIANEKVKKDNKVTKKQNKILMKNKQPPIAPDKRCGAMINTTLENREALTVYLERVQKITDHANATYDFEVDFEKGFDYIMKGIRKEFDDANDMIMYLSNSKKQYSGRENFVHQTNKRYRTAEDQFFKLQDSLLNADPEQFNENVIKYFRDYIIRCKNLMFEIIVRARLSSIPKIASWTFPCN